ncbi:MAG: FAD:protein FMN transferase [Planctomycetes bacterium]|nr:FAD:protein FMN transferase [Planctomycetota bacterium]
MFIVSPLSLTASEHYLDTDEALALAFPQSGNIEVFIPTLNAQQVRLVKDAAASKAKGKLLAVYVAHSDGALDGISIIDKVRCRTLMMTFCASFNADGKIKRIDIMDYPEPIGNAVKGRKYLRRFNGRAHGEKLRNRKEIPNISGSSLSCRALVERMRFLLAFQSIVLQEQVTSWLVGRESAASKQEVQYKERSIVLGEPILRLRFDAATSEQTFDQAFDLAREWDERINTWNSQSELSKLLKDPNQVASKALVDFINSIFLYHKISSGTLDPSIKPLLSLWSQATDEVPDSQQIAHCMQSVGLTKCQWNATNGRLKIPKNMQWDVSAISKGWIIEELAQQLRAKKVTGLISYGDSSYVSIHADLTLAIRSHTAADQLLGEITLRKNQALASSGFGMRYFKIADKKYHHIIDVHSGQPMTDQRSAHVLASDAAAADALATICCVQSVEESLVMINAMQGVEVLIEQDGKLFRSKNWPAFIAP